MTRLFLTTAAMSLLATGAFAATLDGSTGYALSKNGRNLTIIGDLAMPSDSVVRPLSGRLNAIAYRPVTGELYGYRVGRGDAPDAVFTIDTATGALTDTGAMPAEGADLAGGSQLGFDFNNQIDAARIVTTRNENNVFFPGDFPDERAGSILQFTDLFYGADDVNAGIDPQVFANAYTNAVDGTKAATTLQYALDARTDSLVTLANNDGTLSTIAPITLDGTPFGFGMDGGFDILSLVEGDNLGVALLSGEGGSGLYTIDLGTGAATLFGSPGTGAFASFAAQTAGGDPNVVPLPAGLPLIFGAFAALGGLRAMRRTRS